MLMMVSQKFKKAKFKRKNNVVFLFSSCTNYQCRSTGNCSSPNTVSQVVYILKLSDEELREFFIYEMSSIPMPLFSKDGTRKGTKSSLYSVFQPVTLNEKQELTKFVIADGGHLFHKVVWPRSSSFSTFST